jgi:hypothetical protein
MVTHLVTRAIALLILVSATLVAQDGVQYATDATGESKVWIDGSSNNGEFNCYVDEFAVEMEMAADATAENPGLSSVSVTIPAKKVVSRKSVIMDRLTHNAFKANQNPDITYELTSAEVGEGGVLKTIGNLTLAGVTKEIEMDVTLDNVGDGSAHFVGSYGFNMTEFEIEPPTALFGRFRVQDPVVVHFDLVVATQ